MPRSCRPQGPAGGTAPRWATRGRQRLAAGTHLHLPTAAGTVLQDKKASLKPHKLKLTTHAEILRIPAGVHLENTRAVATWGQQNCEPPAAGGNLSNPPAARELLPASKDCPSARRLARMYGCPYPTEKYNLRSACACFYVVTINAVCLFLLKEGISAWRCSRKKPLDWHLQKLRVLR